MKTFLIPLLFLCLLTLKTQAQTKNFIDQPYIETIAKVDTLVIADKIFFSVAISEKDLKNNTTLEHEEQKMLSSLKEIGIDIKEDVRLIDLASYFKGGIIRKKELKKGKVYSVMVKDAYMAGKLIMAIDKIEVSNIRLEKVEYSKIEELKLDLKTKVIKKAKRQAEALVKPLNQKIGKAIFISDFSFSSPEDYSQAYRSSYDKYSMDVKYNPSSKFISDLQLNEIKVKTVVNVRFKIE